MITLLEFMYFRYVKKVDFNKSSFWVDFKLFFSYELSKSAVRCGYYNWSKSQFKDKFLERDYNRALKDLVKFEETNKLNKSGIVF